MKVNISMPDELFEKYVVTFGLPAAYARMRAAIELCKDIQKDDRTILVTGDTRRALEAVFMTTIDDSTKLLKLVQNMNSVKLGEVEMSFSADQLERISSQAGFHGRTPEVFIREMVDELKAAMLEKC